MNDDLATPGRASLRPGLAALVRLSACLLLVALATSRLTLILHERVGHGVVAQALGSTIERYHLYWFAGGFVEFHRSVPYTWLEEQIIFLGGIGVELITGVILLAVARKTRAGSIARITLLGYATIDIVHAGYYLTAGTFHGFGDGALLHRELGADRVYLVAALTVPLVAITHGLARHLVAHARLRLPEVASPWRSALVATAALLAGGAHGVLSFGELVVSPEPTYLATMRPQSEREVQRELDAYVRAAEKEGTGVLRELEDVERELRARHSTFPFARLLLALIAAALLAGMIRARSLAVGASPRGWPLAWRDLALPAVLAMVGLALVGVLR